MSVRIDILHIGTLSRNPYWNDKVPRRPAVATMSLLTDGDKTVLVDPGLPPELIAAALDQRCGKSPEDIDFVFLTNRRPAHVRGLPAVPNAKALMFEREIEQWAGDAEAPRQFLERVRPAPERITERIHLFPTPGPTRGHCSLLVLSATANIMVAGDAVVTRDHYEHGAVYEKCDDREAAKESLAEVIELADVIIPAHDNIFFAKAGGMF